MPVAEAASPRAGKQAQQDLARFDSDSNSFYVFLYTLIVNFTSSPCVYSLGLTRFVCSLCRAAREVPLI